MKSLIKALKQKIIKPKKYINITYCNNYFIRPIKCLYCEAFFKNYKSRSHHHRHQHHHDHLPNLGLRSIGKFPCRYCGRKYGSY